MQGENFFKGIPTKIDTDRLFAKFGIPKEGDVISFSDCAKIIGVECGSCRFKTVLDSWRRSLLREHNILMVAQGDGTIKAALPDERIDYASRKVASGRRAVGKAIVVAYGTDATRLSEKKAEARNMICAMNEAKLRLIAGVQSKV